MIRIQTLPQVAAGQADSYVDVPMTSEDRQRVHRRLEAPDGRAFALELATGSILAVGQILHLSGSTAYRVTAAPEEVLVLRPRSLAEAAVIGHLIGNLHRDLDVDGDRIMALWNAPLEHKLVRLGLKPERQLRPFKGKPAGEHSH